MTDDSFMWNSVIGRIIAAEMWQQGKDNIAKEMQQLRKLKMQQVLREMELEAEYKAQNEHYSEEAFKQWLAKQGLVAYVHSCKIIVLLYICFRCKTFTFWW